MSRSSRADNGFTVKGKVCSREFCIIGGGFKFRRAYSDKLCLCKGRYGIFRLAGIEAFYVFLTVGKIDSSVKALCEPAFFSVCDRKVRIGSESIFRIRIF